ncbi:MAG: response regulator, partial [Proteobacteria bacterium]|nr:response regulator [Pseudomonadota bacterium]
MSKKLNVLMIEDSENDALLLVQALKKNGYLISFLRVETAEEMTEALNQPAWDLIISDYNLPRFNGLDALLLLKQKGLDIPFIVVSGSIGEELAVKLMKAGAQDYIMKDNLVRLVPAISRELQEVIERTKRREAEQQLRDSEERYRLLVEHAPDAIFIQCENKFIYVNTPFVKMIKASTAQAILGKNIWDFIHPDCLNIVKKYVEQLDMEVIMPSFEGKFICTDGSIIDVDISAGLCIYHGKYAAHVFIRDISERKKAQSIMQQHQLELDQISRINSMGEMASALAHELNQPLTSIGSFTSGCVRRLQSDVFEKDEIIKVMQIVSEQTKYAGEIIHRMKNFVRRGELSQETTTISEVITHALSLMAFQIQQFSVKICLDLSEGLPQVLLDKIQVEQVILNLSRNAIEAMQH